MKTKYLILIFLIIVPISFGDILTFTSGGGNELAILPFSQGEIGFFNGIVEVVTPPLAEEIGGGGSGQIPIQLVEETKEQKEKCPEGQKLWNDVCYNCTGQLIQVGNDIKCVYCEEGLYDINTDSCITEFELQPFFLVALLVLVVTGYIIGRKDKKEQETRLKEQEELIEKRKKKMEENERRLV